MEVIFYEKRKDYKIMTKRFGFTLAEVLITLGIIGVVAAMTIPTLIANTNGAKFRSQFKKSISTLNQAGLMAQAQYDFDYAGASSKCGDTLSSGHSAAAQHPDSDMTMCAILNGTLTGQTYLGTVSAGVKRNNNGAAADYTIVNADKGALATSGLTYTNFLAYALADGSIVAFNADANSCELPIGTQLTNEQLKTGGVLNGCLGFIDVNGATLPNKEVTCSAIPEGGKGTANKATLNPDSPCTVKNDAAHMTDVFPIVFHDATVEPASDAAKYILTTSK